MIYLDHAATSPVRPEVITATQECLNLPLGNSSSLHQRGRQARMLIENARESCAAVLGAQVEEVVFTSGATESNNLALFGVLSLLPESQPLKVVTSGLEHPSITDFLAAFHPQRLTHYTLEHDPQGQPDLNQLKQLLEKGVDLVTSIVVNNETGSLQPVQSIAELCRKYGTPLHLDAVQAHSALRLHLDQLPCDFMSLSGHKLGGLHGGLLFVRKGHRLAAMIRGGGQEDLRRAGTHNPISIYALQTALETHQAKHKEEQAQLTQLKSEFEQHVAQTTKLKKVLPQNSPESPHISAWYHPEHSAEVTLVQLDLAGIAASSGSACSSHSLEPSSSLITLGFEPQLAKSLLRFSFGWNTSHNDLTFTREKLAELFS